MTKFAIRGLLSRKLRTALTALAIVLGVAMICGTYVLTDSIDRAFDKIFTDIRQGSNAVITGQVGVRHLTEGSGVDEPTLRRLAACGGAGAARRARGGGQRRLRHRRSSSATTARPSSSAARPTSASRSRAGSRRFNPLTLIEGAGPGRTRWSSTRTPPAKEDFEVGETIGVQAEGPVERLPLAGIIQFSSGLTIGGATLAGFDLPTAQRLMRKEGQLDEIAVAAKPDVEDAELVRQIEEILPPGTQVRTAGVQAESDAEETNEFITILQRFLLAFGGIALFVGSFVIANSLSITIAQRTRELATLRIVGASRRQVLARSSSSRSSSGWSRRSSGSSSGCCSPKGLFSLFDAAGLTLPNTGLVFEPRTAVVALAAGILVTLVASLRPAIRATRVPPVAAVREGADASAGPLRALPGRRARCS